jgi:zinc D-Ala-D-Ala carboxypeptidase
MMMKIVTRPPDSIRLLVNREYPLPAEYEPNDLVIPEVQSLHRKAVEPRYLRAVAAEPLAQLFQAVIQSTGVTLVARSGYRSYETQRQLFESRAQIRGTDAANRTTAKPGQSEHQTGLAMDVTSKSVSYQLSAVFGDTVEGRWLADNAHHYGFIIRYPAGQEIITGYLYEPWHLRYVGVELSEELYRTALTMEAYHTSMCRKIITKRGQQAKGG